MGVALRVRVQPRSSTVRCAFCHDPAGRIRTKCPICSTLLHLDCWRRARRCPTLGCIVKTPTERPPREERTRTPPSVAWAFLLGILLPWLLLAVDPIVFRGRGVLGPWIWGSYVLIAIQTLLLGSYLLLRARLSPALHSLWGGGLLVGALGAGVIGLGLLPLSIAGLFILIGALGFIPFLTARIYLQWAQGALDQGNRRSLFVAGALLALLLPLAAQVYLPKRFEASQRAVAKALRTGQVLRGEVAFLRAIHTVFERDPEMLVSHGLTPHTRGLAAVYRQVTGEDCTCRRRRW